MGKRDGSCIYCNETEADLPHFLFFSPKLDSERELFDHEMKASWSYQRFVKWTTKSDNRKLAEMLGIEGNFTKPHAIAVKRFLSVIYRTNKPHLDIVEYGSQPY